MTRSSHTFLVLILATAIANAGAEYRRVIERVASLDPIESASVYSSRCVALVYETLLEYDYDKRPYELRPLLSVGMPAVSSNGLEWIFTIDTNACFCADPCFGSNPDGSFKKRRVTASDFVYSFKRLADAKLPSSGYWLLDGNVAGIGDFHRRSMDPSPTDYSVEVPGLRSVGDDKLVIVLEKPSIVFHWLLAMPYMSVVPKEAVDYYGAEFRTHPVGTGPYRLARWRRNHEMRFERSDSCRGELGFDVISMPIIDDASTQWLCFLNGELDVNGEVSRDNWDEVVMADGSLDPRLAERGISLHVAPTLELSYIGFNMDDPVLGHNKYLRQALNAAFDTAAWESFYRGRMVAVNGPVPPSVAGAVTNNLPYGRGLDAAKELLKKAGYPGGRDPDTGRRLELTLDVGKTTQDMRESSELLVSFMARCGVRVNVEYNNWPAFLQKVSQRRSQMFRIAWVGDYPDAENFLQLFYGPSASPGPNRSNFSNPEFDRLFREAQVEVDEGRRLGLYAEMQEIVREESPWVFIGVSKSAALSRPTVANFIPHDFPYGMEKHLRKGPGR